MSANLSRPGPPTIPLDMTRARALLSEMPFAHAAEALGVHRNTLYRRVQTDPLWRECVQLPRARRIPYQPDPFQAFIARSAGKLCGDCNEEKPLVEFPRKGNGKYRSKCKDCTRDRWNELQEAKRCRRDEGRAEVLRVLLPLLAELAWRVRCFNRVRPRPIVLPRSKMGRPCAPISIDAVLAVTEQPHRSVRAIARALGVNHHTLRYRLKIDPRLADAVTRGIVRPTPKVRERAFRVPLPKIRIFSLDAPVFASDGLVGDRHGVIADPNAEDPLGRLLEREAVASVVTRLVRERGVTPSAALELVSQHVDVAPVAHFPASDGVEKEATPEPVRLRIGWHNYREVARDFNPEQLKRLAKMIKRHDRATCEECAATSKKRGCSFVVEAVEVVALGVQQSVEQPDFYPATDFTRQLYREV